MSLNINNNLKNQQSSQFINSSFLKEYSKNEAQSLSNINLASQSQLFYKINTPQSPAPQFIDTPLQQNNSFISSRNINSPYISTQTPLMRMNTPIMQGITGAGSQQINNEITFYNSNQNKNNILSISKKNSSNLITSSNDDIKESTLNIGSNNNEIVPVLQNIVSTADLGCKLELRKIALQARNAEYNPKRFAAVIMRIKEPKTTALIFSSGKMVCTGAKSEDDSKKASRKYAKIIKSLGFNVTFKENNFKVENIVGSCDIKFQIRLTKLNNVFMEKYKLDAKSKEKKYICQYEPEIFPGLIYHMSNPAIVLLIFVSGKIVLTGAKKREQIFEAFKRVLPLLKKCKYESKEFISNKMLHKQEVKEIKEEKEGYNKTSTNTNNNTTEQESAFN